MHTKLGRYQAPEPARTLARLHWHRGGELREVDHEPPLAVLDQEDLLEQGIHTSELVPGAQDVDALGSCVFNASTAHLSSVLPKDKFCEVTGASGYDDTVGAEEFAIRLYHETTDLTGNPSTEWPPTDCGSSGPYVVTKLERQGVIRADRVAHGADHVVSLMQANGVIVGQPWFRAWFEPDSDGFVDGRGGVAAVEEAIRSGLAGGHETYWTAVERLVLDAVGRVDADKTVIRFRNSWGSSWGDAGSGRMHLSTYRLLQHYIDVRQFVA